MVEPTVERGFESGQGAEGRTGNDHPGHSIRLQRTLSIGTDRDP
jgi:hypothetical protein